MPVSECMLFNFQFPKLIIYLFRAVVLARRWLGL